MNIVSKALDEIKFQIPEKVLRLTFIGETTQRTRLGISLDEHIRMSVIRPRVMIDVNILGGQTIMISLEGLYQEPIPPNFIRIEIPKDRTQNRSIIQPLSVMYSNQYLGIYAGGFAGTNYSSPNNWKSMSPITSAAARIAAASSDVPIIENSDVELVGENTIGIKDSLSNPTYRYLTCVVEYDDNLSSINLRSYPVFAKLAVLATKAFIYNKMIITLDRGYLEGGQELGAVKEVISTYSDSEQQYQEALKNEWLITSHFNDSVSRRKLLKMAASPGV